MRGQYRNELRTPNSKSHTPSVRRTSGRLQKVEAIMSDNNDVFDTLFGELVLKNRCICSNCFRRNADRFEITHKAAWTTPHADRPVELDEYKKHERLEYHHDNTIDAVAGETSAQMRETRACGCGVVATWMRNRPISKERAYDMMDRLVERISEEVSNLAVDVDVSENDMWNTFKELKTDPDKQFADDRIFADSVEAGTTIEQADQLDIYGTTES